MVEPKDVYVKQEKPKTNPSKSVGKSLLKYTAYILAFSVLFWIVINIIFRFL